MSDLQAELVEKFRRLGAPDPESWASSQIREGTPHLHRFLFLRKAWAQIADEADDSWIERTIETSRRRPDDPYSGMGHALERMLDMGVERADIVDLVRASQAEMLFGLCYLLEDPSLDEDELEITGDIGWALVTTDENYEPTSETLQGLHESVLHTDPTGREMRPRAKPAD